MKIGINMDFYKGLTDDEQISLMKQNGFTSTFFFSNTEALDERVSKLRRAGMEIDFLHAPYRGINDLWLAGEAGEKTLSMLIENLENCKRNAIGAMVFHLSSGDHAPCVSDVGFSRLDRFMEHARRIGVTPIYENQRKLGAISCAFERYSDAVFCWDVGHEACLADGKPFMPLFGEHIVALHLHDNFCVHDGDLHLIPYDGSIDMERTAQTLAKSRYIGPVMLELHGADTNYPTQSPAQCYERAANAARKFAGRVELYRKQ
ncbi:MAG: sugar phosphate isomerase/epimerase [Clostridia bacterium]|nr:sugar phosphate isomerase/epimerase [Clostridia bacterium]